jgi:hypothetical protein
MISILLLLLLLLSSSSSLVSLFIFEKIFLSPHLSSSKKIPHAFFCSTRLSIQRDYPYSVTPRTAHVMLLFSYLNTQLSGKFALGDC